MTEKEAGKTIFKKGKGRFNGLHPTRKKSATRKTTHVNRSHRHVKLVPRITERCVVTVGTHMRSGIALVPAVSIRGQGGGMLELGRMLSFG
jgi:hypothetical protein